MNDNERAALDIPAIERAAYTVTLVPHSALFDDLMVDDRGVFWDTIDCQAKPCHFHDDWLAGQGHPPTGRPGPASAIAYVGYEVFLLCSVCADGDWFYQQGMKFVRTDNDRWEVSDE